MSSNFYKVLEFHRAFGHPVQLHPWKGTVEEAVQLRLNLISEEFEELLAGFGYKLSEPLKAIKVKETIDWAEVADALGDLEYVIHGTAICFGLPSQEVFDEIHRSNMSKLGEDGKPILREDGKILKGPNYSPPDIKSILEGKDRGAHK